MVETLASRPGSTAQVRSARGWGDPALSSVLSPPPEATLAARLLLVRAGQMPSWGALISGQTQATRNGWVTPAADAPGQYGRKVCSIPTPGTLPSSART